MFIEYFYFCLICYLLLIQGVYNLQGCEKKEEETCQGEENEANILLNNINMEYEGKKTNPSRGGNAVYKRYSYDIKQNELKPNNSYIFNPIIFTQVSEGVTMINQLSIELFYREFEIKPGKELGSFIKDKQFEKKWAYNIDKNPFTINGITFTTSNNINNNRPTIENGEYKSVGLTSEIGIKLQDDGSYLDENEIWNEDDHKIEIKINYKSIFDIISESECTD